MGKSSGGSPSIMMIPQQQQSSSTVSLPSWVDQAAQENLRMANDISGRLPGPYTGQRVADMTPGQLSAIDAINQNVGSTTGQFNAASGIAAGALRGAAPAFQNAMSLAGSSINPSSVQSAMSGLQSSVGQAYNPVGYTGTYKDVNATGGYDPLSYGSSGYNNVNTRGADYSPIGQSIGNFNPVDTSKTNYTQVDSSGSGYDRINLSGQGFTPISPGSDPTQQSQGMIGQIYDPVSGGVKSVAGAMDSIGSSYNPVYETTGTAFNSLKNTISDARGMQQFTPDSVSSQTLPQGNINDYLNPYIDNVVNASLRTLDKQRANTLNQNADGAIASKALGGSRQALQDAVTNAEFGSKAANLDANLRSQGFSQAQAALQSDQARNLQAQMANQSAGLQGAGVRQNAAQLSADAASRLGSLGIDTGSFGVNAANTLGNLGLNNANFGISAANTLGQLGLQNRGQNIDAQQANAGFGLQGRGQDITAGQANQSAALQNYQAMQNAQQANMGAALQNNSQMQNAQQANAGMQLQDMAALRAAQQANASLAMQNFGQVSQNQLSNANLAQNEAQRLQAAQQANAGFSLQKAGMNLDAQRSNQNAALQGMQLEQQRQLSNANLGLQQQQQNQNAYNALGSLGLNNAQLTQSGAGLLGNLGNQFANLGLDTSRTLGDLAGAGQQAFLQGANAGIDAGGLLQNQRQNQITAAQQAIADQRSAMLDPITLRLQALGQTPYGQTTTGSSFGLQGQPYQPTSSSPLAGLLGAGLTGLRAASGLGWQPLGR
jgi:hypothetical protein